MRNIRHFAQKYVSWVIRLGRVKFSLLGVGILAIFALFLQVVLSFFIIGKIYWNDILRSIIFGLLSAPFVVYFFTLLVERLERSRLNLAKLVDNLRNEVSERIATEKKLSVALAELEQKNKDKAALMATISHELKTPLNGIIGLSQILLDDNLTETQRNYLKTISMSAISLGHIFGDIIDLEKIDANSIELHKKETDFYRFLSDITNFATLMAEQKQLKFEITYDEKLPHWLMIDTPRLSQILWNLIANAVKFTQEGTISLSIKCEGNEYYSFSVKDTGIGIETKELDNIFMMYYQVQTTKQKSLGSGIGLSVSKILAQLMDGDLTVKSQLNQGSEFTLRFKAEKVREPLEYSINIPKTLHILLVEDIDVNIIVAKSVLEKLGYTVDVAMTGQEAIYQFEQHYYDLLLLDIQLPDMSGFDVAQHLQDGYNNGRYDFLPPLVALTANVMQSKKEYQAKGMDDVLRKPLVVEDLKRCLQEYFGDELSSQDILIERQEYSINEIVNSENFDFEILHELINMLGAKFVQDNLLLFKKTMPDYIKELVVAYELYQQDSNNKETLASVAHKIKGAAASVGLKRLQSIAAKAQDPQQNDWANEIDVWVTSLKDLWLEDVDSLNSWLDKKL